MERYIENLLRLDLAKKMVFLGGPRQVGKTTLAKRLLEEYQGRYFNWDYQKDKYALLKYQWHKDDALLIFDELHKYPKWKNWIKGVYDTQKDLHKIVVTGSARLDIYRRGGDSLLGRYHYWRLHPITLQELPKGISPEECFKRLLEYGGFPEPFLDNNAREARRWRRERLDKVLKDDVRDLEPIKDIQSLGLLVELLRRRVGGTIVASNLARDLQVSPITVKRWLEILEKMYLIFQVRPYTKNLSRAIQKPPKIYFFDNADVEGDEGARFENLVATHLLKRNHFREDSLGHRYELNYLGDKDGREVDFVITRDGIVEELVEVKWSDTDISSTLQYYSERLQPEKAKQIVANIKRPYSKGKLEVLSPLEALRNL